VDNLFSYSDSVTSSRGTTQNKSQKHDIDRKNNKVNKNAKDFCLFANNSSGRTGWRDEGDSSPSAIHQCSAAVKPLATIKPRTIMVVTNENFRSVLIKFSPFYSHTKSDIAHFCTLEGKNLSRFILINAFNSSPFRKDQTKFHAYLISVPAIDPFLTFRVVFLAYRNPDVARRVCEGKRLPGVFSGT
jgi:hypothetical protein